MGGSCWLGAIGFVNAGLELADQLDTSDISVPDRLYVANGTMGTAAGLALGIALAGLQTEIHAVRVTHEFIASPAAMQKLINKTALMMCSLDPSIPNDLAARTRVRFRDGFFAGGYAHSDETTDTAIDLARNQFGFTLDTTYSGKAMAALLHDATQPELADRSLLFWNTYNSRRLPVTGKRPDDVSALPEEFLRYFD